jgi:hypothetical protein
MSKARQMAGLYQRLSEVSRWKQGSAGCWKQGSAGCWKQGSAGCWKHRRRQVLGAPEFFDQARQRL